MSSRDSPYSSRGIAILQDTRAGLGRGIELARPRDERGAIEAELAQPLAQPAHPAVQVVGPDRERAAERAKPEQPERALVAARRGAVAARQLAEMHQRPA